MIIGLELIIVSSLVILLSTGYIFDHIKEYIITLFSSRVDKFVSELLYCPQCMGVWVGMIFYLVSDNLWFSSVLGIHNIVILTILYGCLISLVSDVINIILKRIRPNDKTPD